MQNFSDKLDDGLTNGASRGYIKDMPAIGLREFKNTFSKCVARARDGESISITDRGHIVAELRPANPAAGTPSDALDDLRRRGVLHGAGPNHASLYPAMPRLLKRPVSRLLDDERGSR
jgi:prevent-host-death family protein